MPLEEFPSLNISALSQHLLDSCVKESDDDHNSPDYHVNGPHSDAYCQEIKMMSFVYGSVGSNISFLQIEYDFGFLQAPIILMKYMADNSSKRTPLAALNVSKLFSSDNF